METNAWKVEYVGEHFLEISARFKDTELDELGKFEDVIYSNFKDIMPIVRERIYIPEIIEVHDLQGSAKE